MRKSKAAKKKQKRKVKKKQVKALRFKKATRENGWFYLENADYFFDIGNMDRAVKFVKKAARALPNEEEVFRVMGYIASGTGNTDLELDAMAALERIGKLTDDMKVNRLIMLVNLERYKECSQKAESVLENFTRLKIKNKREIKKKIEDIKAYCRHMILMEEDKERQNAMPFKHTRPIKNKII